MTQGSLESEPASAVRRRCLLAAGVVLATGRAAAQQAGSVALKLAHPAGGVDAVNHDAQTLAKLGRVQLTVRVPWSSVDHVYEGVPLKRLVSAVKGEGRPIRLKALNDYQATIPWDDLERYDPILAWSEDGQPIPVRAKGPLLVIYPFNTYPELRRSLYTDRSVWHVSEIIVE